MHSYFARSLALAVVLAAIVGITAQTRVDVDLWGHVRFGMDMLDARALHGNDPYSFTSDRPWINHEWLAEIVMALAWRAGGNTGLVLLKLGTIVLALALVRAALVERGVAAGSRPLLLGLAVLGMLPRVLHVRPQLFSVVLFAALLLVLSRAERRSWVSLLWAAPVLLLWANFHGGWLVGVGTLAAWCAGEAWRHRRAPRQAAVRLLPAAAGMLSTLVNPYGAGLWAFLYQTVGLGREAIREWGPAWTDSATLTVWSVFALLAGASLRPSAPLNPASYALPVLWGLAALRVGRLDAFFALSTIVLLSDGAARVLSGRRPSAHVLPPRERWLAGALAAATIAVVPPARGALSCVGFYTPRWPEPDVVPLVRELGLSGRMATYFDWGEYAIWHLHPELPVSLDGRRETVFSDRVIRGHLQMYSATAEGLAYLDELSPSYVWVPRVLPLVPALTARGWHTIFAGPQSAVLAAPALPPRDPPPGVLPPLETRRCFPGP